MTGIKHLRNSAFVLAAVLACTAGAAHASEPLDLQETYSGISSVDVNHIESMNIYGDGSLGTTNSFAISAGTFNFADYFLKSSANPPIDTFFMGVSTDHASAEHLVLAVGSAYAAGLVSGGEDFSEIFPNYSETSLISDLTLIDGFNPQQGDPGYDTVQTARSELVDFGFDLSGRGGFTPALGGPLTLLSFSSATVVGSGSADLINVGTPAPEPASWALMIAGFGVVGASLRRRSAKIVFA
jgi:hypothetical protein